MALHKYLIQDGDNMYSIRPSFYSNVNAIPKMTSNVAPSGMVTVSAKYSTYDGWMALDESDSTYWRALVSYGWLMYKFKKPTIIYKYSILLNGNISHAPKNFTFEGSNDGVNFVILDTRNNITNWVVNTSNEYTFDNNNRYLYYRLNIANSNSTNIYIYSLKMYENVMEYIKEVPSTINKDNFIYSGIDDINTINDLAVGRILNPLNELTNNGFLFSYPLRKDFNCEDYKIE